MMQLSEDLAEQFRQWAAGNRNVSEIWLFGSRAMGTARPDSDIDLAITLAADDEAAGNYVKFADEWQSKLATISGHHVSLTLSSPETEVDGIRLWARF